MANILVVGASRGSGALTVKQALAKGHSVSAFARSPERLGVTDARLKLIKGDFFDLDAVTSAIRGHDAVVVAASPGKLGAFKQEPSYFSRGTGNVIEGMKRQGVRRIVVLSALGTGDSRVLLPWLMQKLLVDWLVKLSFADHLVQEDMVRSSGLDFVVVRAARLTDGPASSKYVKTTALERVPATISRADLAEFLVESCTSPEFVGKTVHIGG